MVLFPTERLQFFLVFMWGNYYRHIIECLVCTEQYTSCQLILETLNYFSIFRKKKCLSISTEGFFQRNKQSSGATLISARKGRCDQGLFLKYKTRNRWRAGAILFANIEVVSLH